MAWKWLNYKKPSPLFFSGVALWERVRDVTRIYIYIVVHTRSVHCCSGVTHTQQDCLWIITDHNMQHQYFVQCKKHTTLPPQKQNRRRRERGGALCHIETYTLSHADREYLCFNDCRSTHFVKIRNTNLRGQLTMESKTCTTSQFFSDDLWLITYIPFKVQSCGEAVPRADSCLNRERECQLWQRRLPPEATVMDGSISYNVSNNA